MTTVGSLAWSISANTQNFTAGVVGTKAELRDLKSAFLAGQEPVDKYSSSIAHLESLAAKFPDKAAGLQSTIAKMRTEMQKAEFASSALGKVMGRVGIVLDPVSAGFQAFHMAMSAAHTTMALFESLVSKVADSMERLDELAKTSRNLGIAAADLVGFRRAAEDISGVDAGTFDKAFTKFGTNVGQAAMTGKGPAADALKRLGLNAGELSQMGVSDQLLAVADALQKVENVNERLALSKGILGKGGEELATMLAAGGDAIRELIEDQNTLAQTRFIDLEAIEHANDAMGRLSTTLQGIIDSFTSSFAPLVESIATSMVEGFTDATSEGESLRRIFEQISEDAARAADQAERFLSILALIPGSGVVANPGKVLDAGELLPGVGGLLGGGEGRHLKALMDARDKFANRGEGGGASQAAIEANIDQKAIDASRKSSDKRMADWQKMQDLIVNATEYEAEVAKKAQDKLLKEKQDAMQRVIDMEHRAYLANEKSAEAIAKSQMTGAEKLREDFEELKELQEKGFFDENPEAYAKGLEDLRRKSRDMAMVDSGPRTVGAIRGGSVEALRQEFSQKNNTEKQLEEQKKIEENTRDAAELLEEIKRAIQAPALAEAT